jgi:hypothetical protein
VFAAVSATAIRAEDAPKPPDAPPPTVLMSHPIAVVSGTTTRVVLRGMRLDEIAAVRTPGRVDLPTVEVVKVIKQEKSVPPPEYPSERAGDSRVEAELQVPEDAPAEFTLTVVDKLGRTTSCDVLCLRPEAIDKEIEPNDGFMQAQTLRVGKTVLGEIHDPRNVDVFRIEPTGGKRVVVEVVVAPSRSLLDPLLTLHAADGRLLAAYDDAPSARAAANEQGPDVRWELPSADEVRYLVLYDANDRGAPTHGYLLRYDLLK